MRYLRGKKTFVQPSTDEYSYNFIDCILFSIATNVTTGIVNFPQTSLKYVKIVAQKKNKRNFKI